MSNLSTLPEWPEPIVREGPYRVYKGHKYTVYDDGNSAETPYQTDLAEAAIARLRVAVEALREIADDPDSDCAHWVEARTAITAIGEVPK